MNETLAWNSPVVDDERTSVPTIVLSVVTGLGLVLMAAVAGFVMVESDWAWLATAGFTALVGLLVLLLAWLGVFAFALGAGAHAGAGVNLFVAQVGVLAFVVTEHWDSYALYLGLIASAFSVICWVIWLVTARLPARQLWVLRLVLFGSPIVMAATWAVPYQLGWIG